MKHRLRGCLTYQVGPMDRALDGGVQWRQQLTPILHSRGILVIDPCNKPIDDLKGLEDIEGRKVRQKLKLSLNFKEFRKQGRPIRTWDLRFVDKADFLIVHLDMSAEPCGTWEEIFTANKSKKPVLVHCANGISKVPDWLLWTLPPEFFFNSWEALLEYIRHIDEDEDVDLLDRWRPIDFSKLIDMKHFISLFNIEPEKISIDE